MANVKVGAGSILSFPVRDNASETLIHFNGELQVFNHFNEATGACVFFAYDLKVTLALTAE